MFDKYAWICSQIVEMADDAVIAIDKDLRLILFNRSAEKMFGYDAQEVLGEHLNVLIPDRYHLKHNLLVPEFGDGDEKVRAMGGRNRKIFAQRKDGSEFQTATTIMKMGSRNNMIYAAVLRDLSAGAGADEEISKLAATDPVTGSLNQREFVVMTDRECMRARRYSRPLSVLIIQVDHFNNISETYGHSAVDKVLRHVTTVCGEALRSADVLGRWGESGFAVLLPETPFSNAKLAAERLRKLISADELEIKGRKLKVTVSIGAAEYRDSDHAIDELVDRLDTSVKNAMFTGQDQVVIDF